MMRFDKDSMFEKTESCEIDEVEGWVSAGKFFIGWKFGERYWSNVAFELPECWLVEFGEDSSIPCPVVSSIFVLTPVLIDAVSLPSIQLFWSPNLI